MGGLKGYRCPHTVPTVGRENEFSFCVNDCPHQCLPPAVLFAMSEEHKTNVHRGNMVSPSALKGCPRKLVWSRQLDYYYEPLKMYGALRGSIIHGFLEKPWSDDVLLEKRFFYEVTTGPEAPYTISGQVDGYYIKGKRRLEDYKTMSEKGTWSLYRTGAKVEHVAQVNVYCFLLKHGHVDSPDGPVLGLDTDEIVLSHIFMNRVISTGTDFVEIFTEYKPPNYGKKYPLEIKREEVGKTRRGCPIWHVTFRVPKVPIWSDLDVLNHIHATAPTLVRGFRDPTFIPPGVMGNDDDKWQCEWCPVAKECKQYEDTRREAEVSQDIPDEPSLF